MQAESMILERGSLRRPARCHALARRRMTPRSFRSIDRTAETRQQHKVP